MSTNFDSQDCESLSRGIYVHIYLLTDNTKNRCRIATSAEQFEISKMLRTTI